MRTISLMALTTMLLSAPLFAQEVGQDVPEIEFEASFNMAEGVENTKALIGKHILYIEAFKTN
ncbi:MAG: hypothetical protein ACYTDT_13690 [Planctomycetota bacterium]|jgi:hypothetical protein